MPTLKELSRVTIPISESGREAILVKRLGSSDEWKVAKASEAHIILPDTIVVEIPPYLAIKLPEFTKERLITAACFALSIQTAQVYVVTGHAADERPLCLTGDNLQNPPFDLPLVPICTSELKQKK